MCSFKDNGPKRMDLHIGGRVHQIREPQTKLTNVSQHVASLYEFLDAAAFRPDSAVYSCEDQTKNQSDKQEKKLEEDVGRNEEKAMKQTGCSLRKSSDRAAHSRMIAFWEVRRQINHTNRGFDGRTAVFFLGSRFVYAVRYPEQRSLLLPFFRTYRIFFRVLFHPVPQS